MPAPTSLLRSDDPEVAELFVKKQMQSGYLNRYSKRLESACMLNIGVENLWIISG